MIKTSLLGALIGVMPILGSIAGWLYLSGAEIDEQEVTVQIDKPVFEKKKLGSVPEFKIENRVYGEKEVIAENYPVMDDDGNPILETVWVSIVVKSGHSVYVNRLKPIYKPNLSTEECSWEFDGYIHDSTKPNVGAPGLFNTSQRSDRYRCIPSIKYEKTGYYYNELGFDEPGKNIQYFFNAGTNVGLFLSVLLLIFEINVIAKEKNPNKAIQPTPKPLRGSGSADG
jgi:hypothetical protein